jgi:hypothetical protein
MGEREKRLLKVEPRRLARLMALDEVEVAPWTSKELGQVLGHQMRSALRVGIVADGPALSEGIHALSAGPFVAFDTFEEVFEHEAPPVELLRLIKEFAKAHLASAHPHLPQEVARVMYIASIVVALTKCQERITRLDDESIRAGIFWALDQGWVNERLKALLRAALDRWPAA